MTFRFVDKLFTPDMNTRIFLNLLLVFLTHFIIFRSVSYPYLFTFHFIIIIIIIIIIIMFIDCKWVDTRWQWRHPVAVVAQLVEALHYKPESRGFDSRWCHYNFSLT